MQTIQFTFSNKTFFRILLIMLLVWVLYQVPDVVTVILFSFLLAIALVPLVNQVNRWLPRKLAVLTIFLMLLLVTFSFFAFLIPFLVKQILDISHQLPLFIDRLTKTFADWEAYVESFYGLVPDIGKISEHATQALSPLITSSLSLTYGIVEAFFGALTVFTLSYFLLEDSTSLLNAFLRLFPREYHPRILRISDQVVVKVGQYVRGQLLLMLTVGVLSSVGLSVLHVKFALALGLIFALLELIPLVGPIVATLPAALVALVGSPTKMLSVILLYFIIQQLENRILMPLIFSRSIGLHPFIIIVAFLLGGLLFGLTGVLLAIPTATVIMLFVEEFYILPLEQRQGMVEKP